MSNYLTPSEVAERLKVTKRTLRNWRNDERGPAWTEVGGRVRYPADKFNEYLERNTHDPNEGNQALG